MRINSLKAIFKTAVLGAAVLLLGAGVAGAQQQINLTAGPTTANMPDGSQVPMWGFSCGASVSTSLATCKALNPAAMTSAVWSPVLITIPTGATGGLTINLTNNLTFLNGNTVPTSITIVGQVGGGLGTPKTVASPPHDTQGTTWPVANAGPTFVPPPQGPRVQSYGTEVPAGSTALLPAWPRLKPGTYLLESGTHPSIQVPMGLYGILVVTAAPTATAGVETAPGTAYPAVAATATTAAVPAVTYDAEIPLALGEIDPVQNATVSKAVNTAGFAETTVWSGAVAACGDLTPGAQQTCYPPAVNYTPLYYTINGVAFNKTLASGSLFPVTPATIAPVTGTTGNILVRVVNSGSRMHVPAIVGSQVAGATGAAVSVAAPAPVVTGFKVIAEDGNPLPGVPKIKSEVFMAAGKVYDLMINGQSTSGTTISHYLNALAFYDRELSLSANKTERDAGMLAYIGINGSGLPAASGVFVPAVARADTYDALVAGATLTVSDPSKGVIANDTNVYGVQLDTTKMAANGVVTLNANGTFIYTPNAGSTATSDSFGYCANGTTEASTPPVCATVALGASTVLKNDAGITCTPTTFNAAMATYVAIKTPGVLAGCKDGANLPLSVVVTVPVTSIPATGTTSGSVLADANGGFTATASGAGTYTFPVTVKNSLGATTTTTATVIFPAGSGLTVKVLDGQDKVTTISDYRWVIEEDRTFYINPACSANPPPAGCPTAALGIVPSLGTNFHTSYMPYVAQGCTGPQSCEGGQTVLGQPVVCDVGNGACRPDPSGNGMTQVLPGEVALDPTKRYYISILPGDAANPFTYGYAGGGCQSGTANATAGATCGHGMGGAPVAAACTPVAPATTCTGTFAPVTVITQPSPYPPGKLSVFVFEDDFPLNGENDAGGGIDVVSPNEPGLGGFQIHLWDAMGGNGDFTGQMTYDMFNQPLTNSLAGTKDPNNGNDACPIGANELSATSGSAPTTLTTDPNATGITGMIVTCPKYESDGITLSPLAGQAVIANLMPGRWGTIATPGADRIARGEEWLQTNTLDGQKAHDVFTRIGEPSYFQEFGPASYHVSIGFANPAIINARKQFVCNGSDPFSPNAGKPYTCTNTITGKVTGERLSRTPDERLYSSGSHDAYYWSQCYVSFGDPDGEDFAFTKCNGDGTFTLSGLPAGDWRVTVFDQWNDLLVDGLSTPVGIGSATKPGGNTVNMGDIASTQWQANLYTRTFIDENKDGISTSDEAGIPFANVAVRLRDGSLENLLVTDFTGTANFNETFPLFSWYTVETDVTRYKNTGTHVVYDVGGPADGSASCGHTGYPPCGTSTIGKFLANTAEIVSVPMNLRVPGSVYCAGADCTGKTIQAPVSDPPSVCTTSTATPPITTCSTQLSSGRIDNPWSGGVEGWQGFPGQNNFLEFGKEPYIAGENGGIKGHVIYASTRPFDDPMMLVQTQWESLVPHVTINLYQEGLASDGVTPTLTMVDTTQTSSWDDYAQGFRPDGVTPNMNCPGQGASSGAIPDLFFFSLYNQPNYLNFYASEHGGPALTSLPDNSQFKCYDGMHNWNQLQPAPYDGMYKFPSVTAVDANGKPTPTGTNCKICIADPVPTPDLYAGIPMLPAGKYVVEVVLPQGYELVKEEDKNILIGDNFIAPVTQEFGGLGNIFIIPDQASVASSQQYPGPSYNANNAQNPTTSLGTGPSENIVPGFIPEPTWPCVGEMRIVPDYISLYPQSKQVAPFAGASRPLCDRKEVTLTDQMGAIAKFYVYTSTHIASKFTGGITDDYTSEFDPFSPQFGEKFAPPDLPVSVKDWAGNEISRVYADHWGSYDGITYSTWEVNPPNPTGYSPTMMIFCMNDPGPIPGPGGTMITDPAFAPGYSQFCYELPFMPGTTQYLDTPVVPTSAFAGAGYNNVDCGYPSATPAISEVDGDGIGPWVSASGAGHTLKITALGDQTLPNYAYSGPAATTAPYNQKTITRHYGFGGTAGTVALVGSDGVAHPLTSVSWSDLAITGTVPSGVPNCTIQQRATYAPGATTSQCGQLVITTASGQHSIDTVTVTIGGKAPTRVAAGQTIQSAIDAAAPGDLIIVPAGTYNELVIMWKPVRLQGVGSASSVINANTQPAGKLDPWRRQIGCLFGMAINGTPYTSTTGTNPYDPTGTYSCPGTGWNYFSGIPNDPQVDRLPLEGIVGWDTSTNGSLAQLLQEPTLMGAYEGAAITVVAKGVRLPAGAPSPFGNGPDTGTVATEGQFPLSTRLLTNGVVSTVTNKVTGGDDCAYTSNFLCNPSRIDGLGLTDSSQGGGGIFDHAWAHYLEVSNNHVYDNAGTLTGGIVIGQGESPDALLTGNGGDPLAPTGGFDQQPWTCVTGAINPDGSQNPNPPGFVTNQQLPYCYNQHVSVHNNNVSLNSSTGDELFAATPAAAGGITMSIGADNFQLKNNWVCGNLGSGDGGGVSELGFSFNGDIEHNTIIFNQSLNPTIPANGGGLIVMGGAPDGAPPGSPAGTECGSVTDVDCAPGVSDGIGPGLVINANLIMGNSAETGSGGGLRLQNINGSEVVNFPLNPERWYSPTITNNIIADNVAGWDGAGVSMVDALNVNFINNTVVSNSTTASAGILFTTIGAPEASGAGTDCTTSPTTSCPQPSGLVSIQNSAPLVASLPAVVLCPAYHSVNVAGTGPAILPRLNGTCKAVSYPLLQNNIFWQNSAYYIGVGALSAQYQQNVVSLYNAFTSTLAPTQPQADATTANGAGATITGGTGACVAASYWDIGVRNDTGPTNHGSGVTLFPYYSVLTSTAGGYGTAALHNTTSVPNFASQYCDGARTPPEFGASGWAVPPGIADATVPNPIFNLTPVATVDEGNNWINLRWGPLSMVNPVTLIPLANYALTTGSPIIDFIPTSETNYNLVPRTDFFGNVRPDAANTASIDPGAVEFVASGTTGAILSVTGGPLTFTSPVGITSAAQTLTLHNTGTAAGTGITLAFSSTVFTRPAAGGTCTATLAAGATCTINVVFTPTAVGAATGTLTITANVAVTGSPVTLSGNGVADVIAATLTPATWTVSQTRNCPGTGLLGAAACLGDPAQAFTLTNTGNVPLTGIAQAALGGTAANDANYVVVRLLSTCGPAGGGQLMGLVTLAPGGTCNIEVAFRPLTAQAAGAKPATISVTDLAGTQTSTLNGTAQ